MRTAVFSTKSYDREWLEKANHGKFHELVFFESSLKETSVKLAEGFQAVCVFVNDDLNSVVIEQLARYGIRLIVLRCAGFNNVDIASAHAHNITVLRVPAYSPHAVAEHAVALILTLNRKTHKAYNRVREGNFSVERLNGFELHNKITGVIGTGRIGEVFASIMQGFGSRVVAFDRNPKPTLISRGIEYLPLDELLRIADIVSLHCPLTPETHHLINKHSLKKMKKGAMLINTSRGKLIDTEAVIEALKTGHLGYLGMDVYEQEENLFFRDLSERIIADDKIARLMTFPNVLITAHQAFFTDYAMMQIAETTIKNMSDFEKNTINPANLVTPDMIK